jgi:hypothetical protein
LIIVKFQGGLGNQMFQYALGKALQHSLGVVVKFDYTFLEDRTPSPGRVFRTYDLDLFGLEANRATPEEVQRYATEKAGKKTIWQKLGLLAKPSYIQEPHYTYWPQVFQLKGPAYLDGYWQSAKYFAACTRQLRNDFKFAKPVLPESASLLHEIEHTESVCINVRRSDLLKTPFHLVCGDSYFRSAIAQLQTLVERPRFFVFSDDKAWCKSYFAAYENTMVIGEEHDGFKYGNKLQLMAACKHFIIPNSTFAWWAIWLANRKDNLVIAPKNWFSDPAWDTRDLLLPEWSIIDNQDER